MAKNYEEVKEELDQELAAVYNRDDNRRKLEKISSLMAVRKEIGKKKLAYDEAVKNEDFENAVDLQIDIEHLEKKEKIMGELVTELEANIPDYPYEDIMEIAGKMRVYQDERYLELLKEYYQKLLETEAAYDKLAKEIEKFYQYFASLKHKSPTGEIGIAAFSTPNGASSVSEHIREAGRWIRWEQEDK